MWALYEGVAFWRRFVGRSGSLGGIIQAPLEVSFRLH